MNLLFIVLFVFTSIHFATLFVGLRNRHAELGVLLQEFFCLLFVFLLLLNDNFLRLLQIFGKFLLVFRSEFVQQLSQCVANVLWKLAKIFDMFFPALVRVVEEVEEIAKKYGLKFEALQMLTSKSSPFALLVSSR